MHNLLAWKRLTSLIKFLRMDFMDLWHHLQNLKMLWRLGKLIQTLLDKKWVWRLWEACEYLLILKGFVKLLGNELCFDYVICELFMFYHCTVMCDYLAKYYSLCDIGILASVFVMVIEFQLCVSNWVPSLWW